ncbi:AraC-like DNA-binding protein [Myroides indicus]|uniref:AraC-like DNA-binding protein n=2 Tax=Myroides indicus TaxID=1323422 RepID=A0A4R7EQ62_9FLAO|nr:AraC-like DNA-binding protein [Myroides indicus]
MDLINANLTISIISFGILVFLSLVCAINPFRANKKANYWFALFCMIWATFWLDDVLDFILIEDINVSYSHLLLAQLFIPIIFYVSVVFYTNPDYQFKNKSLLLLIPLVYLILTSLKHYNWISVAFYSFLIISFLLLLGIVYTVKSFLIITSHQQNILKFSAESTEINLIWLKKIILGILVISFVSLVYNIFWNENKLNIFINSIFLLIVFYTGYHALKQKEIYPSSQTERSELLNLDTSADEEEREKRKLITDSDLRELKNKLTTLMDLQKPYLNSELNLITLSTMINLTPHHLSYVINQGFNENFFQFINKYRVEKAKQLLTDKDNLHLSILGIAFEAGFNSKTAFNTTFKKITGFTPTEFRKKSSRL